MLGNVRPGVLRSLEKNSHGEPAGELTRQLHWHLEPPLYIPPEVVIPMKNIHCSPPLSGAVSPAIFGGAQVLWTKMRRPSALGGMATAWPEKDGTGQPTILELPPIAISEPAEFRAPLPQLGPPALLRRSFVEIFSSSQNSCRGECGQLNVWIRASATRHSM